MEKYSGVPDLARMVDLARIAPEGLDLQVIIPIRALLAIAERGSGIPLVFSIKNVGGGDHPRGWVYG